MKGGVLCARERERRGRETERRRQVLKQFFENLRESVYRRVPLMGNTGEWAEQEGKLDGGQA